MVKTTWSLEAGQRQGSGLARGEALFTGHLPSTMKIQPERVFQEAKAMCAKVLGQGQGWQTEAMPKIHP